MSELLDKLDSLEQQVRTRTLNISLNELSDMILGGELKINPEYQRLFQWSSGAQSRFIESLILEMPVPPIFVVEEEENIYSLVDGLQRLSSYLHFRGQLNAPDIETPISQGDFLTLNDCDIVPQLNGLVWSALPTSTQVKLKRSFMSVEVIRKGNDPKLKYYMFKRLNTGGVALEPQQIRNTTVRLLSPIFLDFIDALMPNEDFLSTTTPVSSDKKNSMYREELILRFFAMKNNGSEFRHDIEDFLTDYIEEVSDPSKPSSFDFEKERVDFENTFKILNLINGDKVFSQYNTKRNIFSGFSVMHYEAIVLGIQSHLDRIDIDDLQLVERLKKSISQMRKNPEYIGVTAGGGKNSVGPFRARIRLMNEAIESAIEGQDEPQG